MDFKIVSLLSRVRDNSESWFKTLMYMPVFSGRFGSLEHTRDCVSRNVHAYNTEHRHSGLGFHAPVDVHFGVTGHIDDQHLAALEKAWAEHPERFDKNRLPKKMLLPEVA